jgi:hypothetical protein
MTQPRMLLPRPNLQTQKVGQLALTAEFEWNERVQQIVAPLTVEMPFSLIHYSTATFASYVPRGGPDRPKHSIMIVVMHEHSDSKTTAVVVEYRPTAEPGMGGGRKYHREREFVSAINALGPALSIRARVAMRFQHIAQEQMWFPLPAALDGIGDEEQYEIRGIRGVKVSKTEPFSFTFDSVPGDTASLTISVDLRSKKIETAVAEALRRATSASSELIWEP